MSPNITQPKITKSKGRARRPTTSLWLSLGSCWVIKKRPPSLAQPTQADQRQARPLQVNPSRTASQPTTRNPNELSVSQAAKLLFCIFGWVRLGDKATLPCMLNSFAVGHSAVASSRGMPKEA